MTNINTIVFFASLGLGVISITACEEKVRTVQYYAENLKEAQSVTAKCRAEYSKGNTIEGKLKENCHNANVAMNRNNAAMMSNMSN